jgi:hypothetical protein
MYEFCKNDGTPVLLSGQAMFVAENKKIGEERIADVSRTMSVDCKVSQITETHFMGLWFLKLNDTFFGPAEGVRLAFRKKELAEKYSEIFFENRLTAVCAT